MLTIKAEAGRIDCAKRIYRVRFGLAEISNLDRKYYATVEDHWESLCLGNMEGFGDAV